MRPAPPRFAVLIALTALLAGASCRGPDASLAAPRSRVQRATRDEWRPEESDGLVACRPRQSASVTVWIGRDGGTIAVGGNRLTIPPYALDQTVRITATVASGNISGVRFEPEGLQFRRPAALSLDATGCNLPDDPAIDYVNDQGRIVERIPAAVTDHRRVGAPIHHFSIYAIGV